MATFAQLLYRVSNNKTNKSANQTKLANFWEMIEAMYDENILIDGWHFRVTISRQT